MKHLGTRSIHTFFLLASLMGSQHALTDDIDIYNTLNNDTSDQNIRHNLLFIMDTSGSMGWTVASEVVGRDYDTDEDYGDSDGRVYIYD